jgi:uncharacterized membrane protein
MADSFFLTLTDYAALALFIVAWLVHGMASDGKIVGRVSLTNAMNAQREAWMRTMAKRELRMIDTSIMVGLQQGTAFFASSSLIAVGGCFALLGASDHVLNVMSELSLSETPLRSVFEIKVLGLITILAFAFFKFGWSYRLFNYCSILIGAVPMVKEGAAHGWELEVALGRAIKMNILAGRHFNSGLRAVFFSIGYLGWFIDPRVFVLTTILLFAVLLRRQFFSAARQAVIVSDQEASGPGNTESILPEKR